MRSIKIKEANTFFSKLIGFSFKRKKIDYGIKFNNCNSIHTLFMLQIIDVIMTDKNNKILFIKENLKPFRLILPQRNVFYTYELPINYIKNNKIKVGKIWNIIKK